MKHLRIALAAASVAVLCGCTGAIDVPQGLPAEQLESMTRATVDATWEATGLSTRPAAEVGETESGATFFDAMRDCMFASGVNLDGMSVDANGGYTPMLVNHDEPGPADRIAFYQCFAQHPIDPVSGTGIATREQLEYVFDYWTRWLMPCIAMHGYSVANTPERQVFVRQGSYTWSAYGAVTDYRTIEQVDELKAECGPEYGALAGP